MAYHDYPPVVNHPAPVIDRQVRQAVGGIALTDSGLPFLRFVWGQSPDASYTHRGERHLSYRHHVKREPRLGEPAYGLDGKLVGYKRLYKQDDILPACLLNAVELKTDIGISRWFVEQALPIDVAEWEADRYQFVDGELVDVDGPPPEGGISYELLYVCSHPIAGHPRECCRGQVSAATGAACYGVYREPDASDIAYLKASWQARERSTHTHHWRDRPSDRRIAEHAAMRYKELQATAEREEAELAANLYQNAIAMSKMYTGDGHGPDLQKYHIGGLPTTPRDNQFKRSELLTTAKTP